MTKKEFEILKSKAVGYEGDMVIFPTEMTNFFIGQSAPIRWVSSNSGLRVNGALLAKYRHLLRIPPEYNREFEHVKALEIETQRIFRCLDEFVLDVKRRLADKVEEGYAGWDNVHTDWHARLHEKLAEDYDDETFVDLAALAMFGWNKERFNKFCEM